MSVMIQIRPSVLNSDPVIFEELPLNRVFLFYLFPLSPERLPFFKLKYKLVLSCDLYLISCKAQITSVKDFPRASGTSHISFTLNNFQIEEREKKRKQNTNGILKRLN